MGSPTVKNYTVYNVTLTDANTEYSQVITDDKCYVRVHAADLTSQFRVALSSANLATGELIFQGSEWSPPAPFDFGDKTIFLRTPNAGAVIQIAVWELS